jgi:hypothetical protein
MDQSYRSVKIEKSRHVVESRPVCLALYSLNYLYRQYDANVENLGSYMRGFTVVKKFQVNLKLALFGVT